MADSTTLRDCTPRTRVLIPTTKSGKTGPIAGFQGGYRGGDEPELEKLRTLHRQAREQRESIWRDRMLADALLAVRGPNAALN